MTRKNGFPESIWPLAHEGRTHDLTPDRYDDGRVDMFNDDYLDSLPDLPEPPKRYINLSTHRKYAVQRLEDGEWVYHYGLKCDDTALATAYLRARYEAKHPDIKFRTVERLTVVSVVS